MMWNPKGLREALCAQQVGSPDAITRRTIADLISIIDMHRPLGPDGKHGDRHTVSCGCELPERLPACSLIPGEDGMAYCMLDFQHGPHTWAFTSEGGGHMADPDNPRGYKNHKLWRCPGKYRGTDKPLVGGSDV